MTIKPKEISIENSLWKIEAGFNEWKYGAAIIFNIIRYLHYKHAENFPKAISKDLFIEVTKNSLSKNIESELYELHRIGYIILDENSIIFTEKFSDSWNKLYEFQKRERNFRGSLNCYVWLYKENS